MAAAPPSASALPSSAKEVLAPPRVVMTGAQSLMIGADWDMREARTEKETVIKLNIQLDKSTEIFLIKILHMCL